MGRERELNQLTAAFERSLSGRREVVMLVGEPGIGKTRTALQFSRLADEQGAVVVWGRGYEGYEAPALWPWIQMIRSYVSDVPDEELSRQMGSGAPVIAAIVESLREKFPDLSPLKVIQDPSSSRFRLFDAVRAFVQRVCHEKSLVLVLDNLHWWDEPSLRLLEFLVYEIADGQLMIVGTYRDTAADRGHHLQKLLASLTREQLFHRIELKSLSREDVRRFVEEAYRENTDSELIDVLHERSDGNPLFMTEVLKLLMADGEIPSNNKEVAGLRNRKIPEGVRELIGSRLDRLSGTCVEMLSLAAVAGREFSLGLLEKLMGDSDAVALVEEGVSAGILEEPMARDIWYRFVHALFQETLLDRYSRMQRVRAHLRIAETLESVYEGEEDEHASELVRHYVAGEKLRGKEKVAHYSLVAGKHAFASHAYEDALEHFERGLAAEIGLPMDRESADLHFYLGKAKLALGKLSVEPRHSRAEGGRYPEIFTLFLKAFNFYEQHAHVQEAVTVASYPMGWYSTNGLPQEEVKRALSLTDPDSIEEARLSPRLAACEYRDNRDPDASFRVNQRAYDIARREVDIDLECRILTVWILGRKYAGQLKRHRHLVDRLLAILDEVEDLRIAFFAHGMLAKAFVELGNLEEALKRASVQRELADKLEEPGLKYDVAGGFDTGAQLSLLAGDWCGVYRYCDELRKSGVWEYYGLDQDWIHTLEVMADVETGSEKAAEHLKASFEPIRDMASSNYAFILPVVSRITGQPAYFEITEKIVNQRISDHDQEARARMARGLMAVQREDRDSVVDDYEKLRTCAVIMLENFHSMTRYRALGIFAAFIGRLDDAIGHYEQGYTFTKTGSFRPEFAWTCCDYADAVLKRRSAGDRRKGQELLEEGLEMATLLGMKPLMKRIQERQVKLTGRIVYPDGLTRREAEILKLIADGLTNQEIASELNISPGTVANHITHVFTKTGTGNRTEAALYARNRIPDEGV